MRTFEIRLSDGRTVIVVACDSWAATCAAIAQYGQRVTGFRWVPSS
jgi:hypothetical protein